MQGMQEVIDRRAQEADKSCKECGKLAAIREHERWRQRCSGSVEEMRGKEGSWIGCGTRLEELEPEMWTGRSGSRRDLWMMLYLVPEKAKLQTDMYSAFIQVV
eukprot:3557853-Rhodomonas_salina.1